MSPSAGPASTLEGLTLESRSQFRVFNTDATVSLASWQHSPLLARVESYFQRFEATFSRFNAESELALFNRRSRATARVSGEMFSLLEACVSLHRRTAGIFNPLVLDNLEAAGYDTSFEYLSTRQKLPKRPTPARIPSLDLMQLDPGRRAVTLPIDLRLDFGGIGKGYAVDRGADLFPDQASYLIDAGGDIYAAGFAPDGGHWRVDVASPLAPEKTLAVVSLHDQGIATSWTTRRRWRTQEGWAHHLIDPRSGQPARSGVIGVTVIASRAVEADVFAKCALILGPEEGPAFLDSQGVHGLLVLADGSVLTTAGWPGY